MTYKLLPPDKSMSQRVSISGQTDPYSQELYNINFIELNEKLKILAILNDDISIPTSHIIESGITFNVLKEHRELLKKKVLLPACHEKSFDEYFNKEKNRIINLSKNFPSINEPNSIEKTLEKRKEFLENNTSLGIKWNFEIPTSLFKKSLLYDLTDGFLIGKFSHIERQDLINKIYEKDVLRRESAIDLSANLPPLKKKIFLSSIHATYHLSGACATLSIPNVPIEEAISLGQKITKSVQNHNIHYNEQKLFRKLLESMNISCTTLGNLNDDNILSLRKDSITHKFRTKYKALNKSINDNIEFDQISDFSQIMREFNEALNAEIRREKQSDKIFQKSSNFLKIIAYVSNLAGLASVIDPIDKLTWLGIGASTYTVFDPLISKLREHIGCEFNIFSERYLQAQK